LILPPFSFILYFSISGTLFSHRVSHNEKRVTVLIP